MKVSSRIYDWLVVWNMNFMTFHHIVNNHPNWRSHIFQRGRYTTNQMNEFVQTWVSQNWLLLFGGKRWHISSPTPVYFVAVLPVYLIIHPCYKKSKDMIFSTLTPLFWAYFHPVHSFFGLHTCPVAGLSGLQWLMWCWWTFLLARWPMSWWYGNCHEKLRFDQEKTCQTRQFKHHYVDIRCPPGTYSEVIPFRFSGNKKVAKRVPISCLACLLIAPILQLSVASICIF